MRSILKLLRLAFWSGWTPLFVLSLVFAVPIIIILLKEPLAVLGKSPVKVESLSGDTTTLRPCKPFGSPRVVYCGVHHVFEDRQAMAGRKIPIHFAVSFAPEKSEKEQNEKGKSKADDPVFMIDGGPGVGKAVIAGFTIGNKVEIEKRRDLVFIDIRGTGRSNSLSCVGLRGSPFSLKTYFTNDPRLYFPLLSVQHHLNDPYDQDQMRQCAERLKKHADLTKYTSTIAATDIDDIRQLLGYERINLSGASYGTRLSLEYARRYPAHVRSLSLTDIVPTSLRMPSTFAQSTERAFNAILADCNNDEACRNAYGNIGQELDAVLNTLEASPAQFKIRNPLLLGLASETVTLSRGPFAMGIRGMLYDFESSSRIPFVISEAAKGNYEPIANEIIGQSLPLELTLAKGLYLSTTCAEDTPFIDETKARADAAGTILGTYRLDQHLDACAVWPKGAAPADWLEPIELQTPALLFSGEVDPSTPPKTGEDVVRRLPNGRLIIMKNEAHGAAANWDTCGEPIETKFFENASADNIDASCADEIERLPFYLGDGG